jgi:hypothetical protein
MAQRVMHSAHLLNPSHLIRSMGGMKDLSSADRDKPDHLRQGYGGQEGLSPRVSSNVRFASTRQCITRLRQRGCHQRQQQ